MKFKSEVQLEALNNATTDTDKFLVSDSSTVKYRTGAEVLSDIGGQAALTNPITGTGTTNYISKFTGSTTLGDSLIYDNGSAVGIGTTSVSNGFLNVYRSTSGTTVRFSNPNGYVDIGPNNTGGAHIYTDRPQFYMNQRLTLINGQLSSYSPNNLSFMLNSGASTAMTILNTNGNVGIGTSSPAKKLTIGGIGLGNTDGLKIEDPSNTAYGAHYSYDDSSSSVEIGGVTNNTLNDCISIARDATRTITIDTSGNVGIGTTNPLAKLNIGGASGEMIRLADSSTIGNPFISFFQTSTRRSYIQYVDSGDNLTLASEYGGIVLTTGTGGTETEKMRITSSGEVGIGTTSPLQKLHVVGNVIADDLTLGGSESTPTINFTSSGGARASIDYNNSTGSITLENKYGLFAIKTGSGGSSSERMRITNAGNVGIGTTNPTYKLHVVGEGYFSSTLSANKVYTTQVCNTSTCNNSSVALTSSGVRITRNIADSSTAFDVTQTNASSTGAIQTWSNSAGEKMRVTQSGDVGIGITSPNAILDVAGDALINGVTIGQGPAVGQQNTVLGKRALGSIVYASANIAIGDSCNTDNDATGLTTIGVELNADTNLDSLNQDCLAISQYNSNAYSNQVPHIYAPKPIAISSGATNIITFDVNHYAGAIVEYMIRLNDGGDYAVGTVYMEWKSNGTGNIIDVRQIEYSDMSGFVFSLGGSGQTLVLTNTSGNNAWVRITVRGMMTN